MELESKGREVYHSLFIDNNFGVSGPIEQSRRDHLLLCVQDISVKIYGYSLWNTNGDVQMSGEKRRKSRDETRNKTLLRMNIPDIGTRG